MWNIEYGQANTNTPDVSRVEERYLGTYIISPVWSFNRMHGSAVSCLSLSADNTRFASGDVEGNIFSWMNQEEELL
jgi:hypothetical protein